MDPQESIRQVDAAIQAHGTWKLKLRTAITRGTLEKTPDEICSDDQCDFGRWLHGNSIDAETRRGMPYKVVSRLHREFHQIAATVAEKVVTGQHEAAQLHLDGPFREKSETLSRALVKWKRELRSQI